MSRIFESDYRLNEGDDVLNRENAVHRDLDLRLDDVENGVDAFRKGQRDDIEAILNNLGETYSGLAAEMRGLLDQAEGGLSADIIVETVNRYFLTDVRRAAILADLRGSVAAAGDTLGKLYDLTLARVTLADFASVIAGLKGSADAAHDTLGELAALVDAAAATGSANATAIATKADTTATANALANRLRGDAAGSYTDVQIAQFLTNLGLGPLVFGQCQLIYSSATQLKLIPKNGNRLWINGAFRKIPASGVLLANTGLNPNARLFVYAWWDGSAVKLEVSDVTHATDATYGHRVRSNDASRTLVGAIQLSPATPGEFQDADAARNVASYYNRTLRNLAAGPFPGARTSSTAPVQVSYGATFYSWGDEAVFLASPGYSSNDVSGQWSAVSPAIDAGNVGLMVLGTSSTGTHAVTQGSTWCFFTTEGWHVAWANGQVSGSYGTFVAGITGMVRQ